MDKWNDLAKQRGPELGGHGRNEHGGFGLRESVIRLIEVQLRVQALVPESLGVFTPSSISHRPWTSYVNSVPQLSSVENGHNNNTEITVVIYVIIA